MENALVSDRNLKIPTSVYGNKKVAGYQEAMRTIAVKDIVRRICNARKESILFGNFKNFNFKLFSKCILYLFFMV
jgi:hypothetical protein